MNPSIIQYFSDAVELKCPTCSLSFQGDQTCRRCKTDLTLLMQTAMYAWKIRDAARQFLLNNNPLQAWQYAQKAQAIHHTKMGELIEQLAFVAMEKHMQKCTRLQTFLFE